MTKKIFVMLGLAVLCLSLSAFSQENARTLTLKESISIALKESHSIKSAEQDLIASQKSLMSWKLGLRTKVDLELTLPGYSYAVEPNFNPITQLDEYYRREINKRAAALTINQPIVLTNTTLYISGDLYKQNQYTDSDLGRLSTIDWSSSFGLNLVQPLLQPNTRKMQGHQVELGLEQSEKNYTQTQQAIIYNVTRSFYQLYRLAREVNIANEEVQQREKSYNIAMNKYKAGILAEVDALQQEVDLASSRNSYQQRFGDYQRQEDDFKLLIGLSLEEQIRPVAQIDIKIFDVNENKAIEEALKRRPEIRFGEISIINNEYSLERTKGERKVNASLNAFYGVDKNADYLSNVMKDFNKSSRVVFTVNVPIWDWGSQRANVDQAKADLKKSELELENTRRELIKEIKDVVSQFNEAKERLSILEKSEELAQKSYDISLERFNNGDIDSEALALDQNRLSDAKLQSLAAQIEYLQGIANLKRSTYWDFENNIPVVKLPDEK